MKISHFSTLSFLVISNVALAARPVNLHHQTISYLNSFSLAANSARYKQLNESIDANQTRHVRVNQTYAGFPVWNGEAIIHYPKSQTLKSNVTLTGTFYEELAPDLQNVNQIVFEPVQAQKALTFVLETFQAGQAKITNQASDLLVYIDQSQKAHWAFHVSFQAENQDHIYQPNFLIDAQNFVIYQQWDNVKTYDEVKGGGEGGNPKIGKLIYDGANGDLASLDIERDPSSATCYLKNDMLSVTNFNTHELANYPCYQPDKNHNRVYWNQRVSDAINGGYSPNDDAYFAGEMLQRLYKELYGIDVLTKNGKPMPLRILTHKSEDNAEWMDGLDVMIIGDGVKIFYPLSSIGVIAHEVSHGFTTQHSNLVYYGQSGAINESFSDMASQVVDWYAYGKNNWQIGAEVVKAPNTALRYMDLPSKDCNLIEDGRCSIDNAKDYVENMNVHSSSGVFNRAFYLLATSPGWNVKKAFKVMVQANSHYWTNTANYISAACGVLDATRDYNYPTSAVKKAFTNVGVDVSDC